MKNVPADIPIVSEDRKISSRLSRTQMLRTLDYQVNTRSEELKLTRVINIVQMYVLLSNFSSYPCVMVIISLRGAFFLLCFFSYFFYINDVDEKESSDYQATLYCVIFTDGRMVVWYMLSVGSDEEKYDWKWRKRKFN